MDIRVLLADISRSFLKQKKIYKYGMKKVSEMDNDEVIQCCHCYCEDNKLKEEFENYRTEIESEYLYCSYIEEYVEYGLCYDMQMIGNGFIKDTVVPEYKIDRATLNSCCNNCKYSL